MAVSKVETQGTWAAANSLSIAAASNGTSDAFTIDGTTVGLSGSFKADNNGTPAANDTVSFYGLFTLGDPDGTGADEYDTTVQGTPLCTVDTNITDPAQTTVQFNHNIKGGKIYAVNNSAGRAITVSFTLYETRMS